ncbi:RsmB/NOP family class I SAM-dependent RNA methyltransferase [Methanopyrus sp.]
MKVQEMLSILSDVLTEHYRSGVSLKESFYRVFDDPMSIPSHRARMIHRRLMELGKRLGLCEEALDDVIQSAEFEDLRPELKGILVAAADEILFEGTSPALVTDAATRKARETLHEGAADFVHAVCFDLEEYDLNRLRERGYDELSLKYHFPPEFVEHARRVLPEDELEAFLEACNRPAVKYVRVNTLHADREEVAERLRDEGVTVEPDPHVPDLLRVVEERVPIVRTETWRKGLVFTQDKASALVGHVLNPRPGEFVVDLCAAPGGKTLHALCLMEGDGEILAVDKSDWRLEAMKEKLEWQRVPDGAVELRHADARELPEELEGEADRVIVDPPCSGMGSVQKRPETRWNLSRRKVRRYAKLQAELLEAGVRVARPGGVIVYSTCTLTLDENEGVVRRVLRRRDDVELEEVRADFGREGRLSGTRRFYPHSDDCQGFFIARLRRRR